MSYWKGYKMLTVIIERPNTIGVTNKKQFSSYHEAECWIESKVEQLADKGWQPSEAKDSTSQGGLIELTHDEVADVILISWHMDKI